MRYWTPKPAFGIANFLPKEGTSNSVCPKEIHHLPSPTLPFPQFPLLANGINVFPIIQT